MVYIENTGLRDCSGFLQIGSHISKYCYIAIFATAIQYNMANREYQYIAYCNILQYNYCNVLLDIVFFVAD